MISAALVRLARVVVVLALVVSTVPAAADDAIPPRPTYLVGGGLGGPGEPCCGEEPFPAPLFSSLLFVEGAYRPYATLPIYVHAMITRGHWEVDQVGGGPWWHVRAGGEFRGCSAGGGACLFVDADVGYLTVFSMSHDVEGGPTGYSLTPIPPPRGVTLGGRIGLDAGGRYIRFRMAIDLNRAVTGDFAVEQNQSAADYGANAALELGLAAAF